MSGPASPAALLAAETRALLTRVDRLRPFVEQETMLPSAVLLPRALVAVERTLLDERARLRAMAQGYLRWLLGPGAGRPASEQQRRFSLLRLRLNDHLSLLDLFSDAITQRSENELGPWLSGMDVAAADALRVDGVAATRDVPILCHVDRGPGAAIRRVKTPLTGGVPNPVAMIRVPRERMVGHGIASSLFHEVGHQGAAILDLVEPLRRTLLARAGGPDGFAWRCWATWVSEIVADLWSVACLGVGSTLGLIGVVGLPRPFVFRFTVADPHPFPWIRVLVSAAIGQRLYPDPQWRAVARTWRQLYPVDGAPDAVVDVIERLLPTVPDLVSVLAAHRPDALHGRTLGATLARPSRHPDRLRRLHATVRQDPVRARRLRPALRFALLGQARWDGRLDADRESREVAEMLTRWARDSTLRMAVAAAALPPTRTDPARVRPVGRTPPRIAARPA